MKLSALNVEGRATSKGSALRTGDEAGRTVATGTEGDPPPTPRAAPVVPPGLPPNPAGRTERDQSPPLADPPGPPGETKEMTKTRKVLIKPINK